MIIDALHGRPAAGRLAGLRRLGIEPWVCVIPVEEIRRGLRPAEEAVARRLFKGLRLAPLGVAEGIGAGGWTANLANFPMSEVSVEHWPIRE